MSSPSTNYQSVYPVASNTSKSFPDSPQQDNDNAAPPINNNSGNDDSTYSLIFGCIKFLCDELKGFFVSIVTGSIVGLTSIFYINSLLAGSTPSLLRGISALAFALPVGGIVMATTTITTGLVISSDLFAKLTEFAPQTLTSIGAGLGINKAYNTPDATKIGSIAKVAAYTIGGYAIGKSMKYISHQERLVSENDNLERSK